MALFVPLISVVILEVGVRLFAPQPPSWLRVYRAHPRLPVALMTDVHALVDTGETQWEVWTDAEGRRNNAMAGIARRCAERSIPLVVVVIPSVGMVVATRENGVATTTDTPDERGTLVRALEILRGLDLRVVDAAPELAKHEPADLYFRFDGHLTPFGHEVVRDLLLRAVPELGK